MKYKFEKNEMGQLVVTNKDYELKEKELIMVVGETEDGEKLINFTAKCSNKNCESCHKFGGHGTTLSIPDEHQKISIEMMRWIIEPFRIFFEENREIH